MYFQAHLALPRGVRVPSRVSTKGGVLSLCLGESLGPSGSMRSAIKTVISYWRKVKTWHGHGTTTTSEYIYIYIYGSVRLIVFVFVINPPGSGREKKYWELLCVKSTRKHFGHAGCIIYDFKFGWKCFGRHGCDNISALELGSARPGYGLVCIGSAQLG